VLRIVFQLFLLIRVDPSFLGCRNTSQSSSATGSVGSM
jgi:hypothetical protein